MFGLKQHHIFSVVFGLVFIVSSAGETLAVKALNYADVPLVLPTYTALLTNQMWMFMVPVYLQFQRKSLTRQYALQYVGMGFLLYVITMLRNISVNLLPGSIFALLISTSILFNMVMSRLILKKVFNRWHIAACAACIASAVSVGFSGGTIANSGIPTALAAAFCIALMTVWQEVIQADWDEYNYRVTEMSIVSGFLASVFIAITGAIRVEYGTWAPALIATASTQSGMVTLVCVSVALPIIKLLVRNSKYATIQNSNAFFFEFIQAGGSLVSSLSSMLLFDEPWNMSYIASLVFLGLGFGLYINARRVAKSSKPPVFVSTDLNPILVSAWK